MNIIFFHGGGSEEDYEADGKLVDSLTSKLGFGYSIHYPLLPNDGTPDLGRRKQIINEVASADNNVILVAHSLGASMLLACLSELQIQKPIGGIFLLATPFWDGNADWVEPFRLNPGFEEKLDRETPLFFYQCHDDEEVPVSHFNIYKLKLPWASFRELPNGGHQFNNDLSVVAMDINSMFPLQR